jgi:hypothetical protein
MVELAVCDIARKKEEDVHFIDCRDYSPDTVAFRIICLQSGGTNSCCSCGRSYFDNYLASQSGVQAFLAASIIDRVVSGF